MNILSVQSWVSYGHVGNAAALFPLQRLGAEVTTINTVQFSNHPGYGSFAGRVSGGVLVSELIGGLEPRGVFSRLDAVLSGYLGDAETLDAVLSAVSRIRLQRPNLLFCCDPVIGDRGPGVYVAEALAAGFRERAIAQADILTPNLFELGFLLGEQQSPLVTEAALSTAARRLRTRMRPAGPGIVLATSVVLENSPPEAIGVFLSTPDSDWLLYTPSLPGQFNGAGDLLSALFLWAVLDGQAPEAALEYAGSAVWGVLEQTARAGGREPMIVQAQEQLLAPTRRFAAVAIDR